MTIKKLKNMTCLKFYYLIGLSLLLMACKTNSLLTDSLDQKMPKEYENQKNSSTIKMQKWTAFIIDNHLKLLIDSALKNNFDMRIALQKVEVARAGLRLNKGILLPEVGANVGVGQRKFGEYTMDGVGNFDTRFSPNLTPSQRIPNPLPDYYVGLQATWEIDLWAKLKNKKKAAVAKFIASQHGKDLIITNLIAEVASIYFELLALDNEIQILKDNIVLQQTALDLVSAQKEAGKANELGIELLGAQLMNSKSLLIALQQQLLEYEQNINYLCGTFPKPIQRDTNYFTNHIQQTLHLGIPSDLLKNRPDILQASALLRAQNADVISAERAFYPSLNINSALGLQSFNAMLLLETPSSVAYNILGGLAAPLLNRRFLKANLMNANAERKQAYIHYESVITNSFREVYVTMNYIKNMNDMFNLKKSEVNLLKQSIATSTELFKAGRANYLEIIFAQKNALQSQLELATYYMLQNKALIKLYKALGGGWQSGMN